MRLRCINNTEIEQIYSGFFSLDPKPIVKIIPGLTLGKVYETAVILPARSSEICGTYVDLPNQVILYNDLRLWETYDLSLFEPEQNS